MSRIQAGAHTGSTFDSFLEEENLLHEVELIAAKRVLAWQLEKAMKAQRVSKRGMAKRLKTSRSQVDRLLDPTYVGVSLDTVSRAARAVGKRVQFQLLDLTEPAKKGSATRRGGGGRRRVTAA
jgi:antitoxin HicB